MADDEAATKKQKADGDVVSSYPTGHWQDARLKFLPGPHIYMWDDKPVRFSASGIIDRYFPKFNGMQAANKWYDGWKRNKNSKYSALIRYVLQVLGKDDQFAKEAICALWESDGKAAANLGTVMHEQIERTCLGYDVSESEAMPELAMFRAWFPEFLRVGGWEIYAPEKILIKIDSDSGHPVWAGSPDCILRSIEDPKKFALLDWKRVDPKGSTVLLGKQATYANSDGFGRHPFQDVPNTKTGKYTVQLNIYAHTLLEDYGIDVRNHMYMVQMHESMTEPNVFHTPRLDEQMTLLTMIERADAKAERCESPAPVGSGAGPSDTK